MGAKKRKSKICKALLPNPFVWSGFGPTPRLNNKTSFLWLGVARVIARRYKLKAGLEFVNGTVLPCRYLEHLWERLPGRFKRNLGAKDGGVSVGAGGNKGVEIDYIMYFYSARLRKTISFVSS